MRKYRTKKWPFIFCLFSGLACSLTFSKLPCNKVDINPTNTYVATSKSKTDKCGLNESRSSKSIRRYNEAYPVGPQLLLVLQ